MNHKNCLKVAGLIFFSGSYSLFRLLLVTFYCVIRFFYRYLFNDTNDVIIRVSICIQYLFIFFTFISLLYSQITKREGREKKNKERKNLKDTPKHWCWYHQYHQKTSRQDESDNIKKGHHLCLEWVTWIAENTSELYHFWMAHMARSIQRW